MDTSLHDTRLTGDGSVDPDDGAAPKGGRVRRRNRMITSCLECRRRKLKCDRLHPCTNCAKGKRDCLFLAPSLDSAARLKLAELKERMGTLERSLEIEATQSSSTNVAEASEGKVPVDPNISTATAIIEEEENLLQPSALALSDAMYDDEAGDIMADLGINVGKMRIADRVGGFVRPRIAEEIASRIKSEMQDLPGHEIPEDNGEAMVMEMIDLANKGITPAFLDPGPAFIAPRSDMLLGGLQDFALFSLLPTKPAADKLLQHYWDSCHPIVRIVHRPSLEARYQLLWSCIGQGIEPAPPVQAIIFATLFTAAVGMDSSDILNLFGVDKRSLIESFQLGTESALGKAHFLRSTKIETLQAFVMYLIPMCGEMISRAHLALVGLAVRLAESMGLHRDPSEANYGPVETHVRRLIWYQLCFLDLRTSEIQGPRMTIRNREFTTKFPLNVNDVDLMAGVQEDSQEWTDMTFARIRFECHHINREVLVDRIRLDQKKITVTGALAKIETARKSMYERYNPMINGKDSTPLQRCALVTMGFLLHRLHIMLLSKFYNSWLKKMPDRIVQLILHTCTQQLEDAIVMETSPDLRPWQWYSRSYHNYHSALVLLVDVSAHPLRRDADRIWRVLDYTFELGDWYQSPSWTRRQIIEHRRRKAHYVMRELRDRLKVYRALRKMKHTTHMEGIKIGLTRPPSFDPADPVSQAADAVAEFNLTPAAFPPSQVAVDKARARYDFQSYEGITNSSSTLVAETQSSLLSQSHGGISNLPLKTEAQNSLPRNMSGRTSQFSHPGERYSAVLQGNQALQPTWTISPSGTTTSTPPNLSTGVSPPAVSPPEDTMPEIDWAEWDQMFPPDLNDGNLDLPPQSLSGTMQVDLNPNTMNSFPQHQFSWNVF